MFGPGGAESIVQLRPGDTVPIDNSGYLAAQTYHRHQVPGAGQFEVWDQFRNPDGCRTSARCGSSCATPHDDALVQERPPSW